MKTCRLAGVGSQECRMAGRSAAERAEETGVRHATRSVCETWAVASSFLRTLPIASFLPVAPN